MAYAKWYASRGAAAQKPDDPEMLRAFDLFREAFGASEEKRVANAKEIWEDRRRTDVEHRDGRAITGGDGRAHRKEQYGQRSRTGR